MSAKDTRLYFQHTILYARGSSQAYRSVFLRRSVMSGLFDRHESRSSGPPKGANDFETYQSNSVLEASNPCQDKRPFAPVMR
jgi:hypothetical protein